MDKISFSNDHYKPCYRDPEFPRWNYPWDELTEPGDYFSICRIEDETNECLIRKAQSAAANAMRRRKNVGKRFEASLIGDGLVIITRTL